MAGIFACTTDDLLGVSNQFKNRRYDAFWDKYLKCESIDERIKIFKEAHSEFPEDWNIVCELCCDMSQKPEYIQELRNMVVQAMEKCNDSVIKKSVFNAYVRSNDTDERVFDIIDKYYAVNDSEHITALLVRYTDNKNQVMYNRLLQRFKSSNLISDLISNSVIFPDMSPELNLKRVTAILKFVNSLCYADETKIKNLISGDGNPDMWFELRTLCGVFLAAVLFKIGKLHEAYDCLEQVVSLIEIFFTMPNGTRISLGPNFNELDAVVKKSVASIYCFNGIKMDNLMICAEYVNNMIPDVIKPNTDIYERYKSKYQTANFDIGMAYLELVNKRDNWFSSVKDEPRFKNCVQRIRRVAFKQK